MENKVLIKVIVPSLDESYDIYIPVNEVIWKVNKLIAKSIHDLSGTPYDISKDNFNLINKDTGRVYQNNEIIINTDIRNSTEILLIPFS